MEEGNEATRHKGNEAKELVQYLVFLDASLPLCLLTGY
jgi:hypothetical protein